MKKVIKLKENEFVLLLNKIISEGDAKTKLSWNVLTTDQRNNLIKLGDEVFRKIKNYSDTSENGMGRIDNILEKHGNGLSLGIPDKDFLEKNKRDIEFVLKSVPISSKNFNNLMDMKYLVNTQLEEPNKKHLLLFHELVGDNIVWSLVNMYDTNIKLWIRLMNERYMDSEFSTIDEFIDNYFLGGVDSYAAGDLLSTMLKDREKIASEIFKFTWGKGQRTEKTFLSYLISIGFKEENIKVFSGEGNYVDRAGIDMAIFHDGTWIAVQVKSSYEDAENAIPYKGISVYPEYIGLTPNFYCFYKKNTRPITFKELFD